jgi:hypothetical protein
MPAVVRSVQVPLDSVYGYEAFLTKPAQFNLLEVPSETDTKNLFLNRNEAGSLRSGRRKFTFNRDQDTEKLSQKRDKITKLCRD